MTKAYKIKQSLKKTKEKRKLQTPKVFQLKLQNLSKSDIKTLERLFLEAKWFYNYLIADINKRLNKQPEKLKKLKLKLLTALKEESLKF